MQTVWIRAVEKLSGFGGHSHLRTWLIGIATNCWRETLRQKSRERSLGESGQNGRLLTTRPADESRLDLEQAVAELPQGYREILLLHDIEGHTHEEIARLLEIDAGTSKSQLSRARRALRRHLAAVSPAGERRETKP